MQASYVPGSSFLYVVGPKGGPFKIGYARNPDKRLGQLQVGHPQKLKIHARYPVPEWQIIALETATHVLLGDRRLNGEWFDVALDEIEAVVQETLNDSGYLWVSTWR